MAKRPRHRPLVTPEFGAQLQRLRGARSRGEICRRVAEYGLTMDRSTLLQYERGTVAAPDPAILWALGRIYLLDTIDELLTVLVMDRTGRQLRAGTDIRHPGLTPAQIRIAELFGSLAPSVQGKLTALLDSILQNNNHNHTTTVTTRVARRGGQRSS